MQKTIADFLNTINSPMATVMVIVLSAAGIWFTIRTKGVQFTMLGEMCRLLFKGDKGLQGNEGKRVSTFEAFMVSLASRVGTGNLAGVATAIVIGRHLRWYPEDCKGLFIHCPFYGTCIPRNCCVDTCCQHHVLACNDWTYLPQCFRL